MRASKVWLATFVSSTRVLYLVSHNSSKGCVVVAHLISSNAFRHRFTENENARRSRVSAERFHPRTPHAV